MKVRHPSARPEGLLSVWTRVPGLLPDVVYMLTYRVGVRLD